MRKLISIMLTIFMVATMFSSFTQIVSAAPSEATILFSDDMSEYDNDDRDSIKAVITYEGIEGASLFTTGSNAAKSGRVDYIELPASGESYMAYGRDNKLTMDFNDFALNSVNQNKIFTAEFKMAYYVESSQKYLFKNSEAKTGNIGQFIIGDVVIGHEPGYGKGIEINGKVYSYDDRGTWDTYRIDYYYDNGWKYTATRNDKVIIPETKAEAENISNLYFSGAAGSCKGYETNSTSGTGVETNSKTFGTAFKDVEVYTITCPTDSIEETEYSMAFVKPGNVVTGVKLTPIAPYGGNENIILFVAKYDTSKDVEKVIKQTLTKTQKLAGGTIDIEDLALASGESAKAFLLTGDGKYRPIASSMATKGEDIQEILNESILIETVPVYESTSVYISGAVTKSSDIQVQYREVGTSQWNEVYPPVYNDQEAIFATSISGLKENTEYEVKALVNKADTGIEYNVATTKTWNSNISELKRTSYKLSEIIGKTVAGGTITKSSSGALKLSKINGSDSNWIVIDGTGYTVESTDFSSSNGAFYVTGCDHVIFTNLTVVGGMHGINVDRKSSDIRIIGADVSGWGRMYSKVVDEQRTLKDENGNNINFDAGIKLGTGDDDNVAGCATAITVEKCYIHDPHGITTTWDSTYDGVAINDRHPNGTCGIFVQAQRTVIRWNDIVGNEEHRFNDAIESYGNFKAWGGLAKDCDVYGNFLAFGQDDGVELDGRAQNLRFHDNRITNFYSGISTAGVRSGPSFIFNNVIHDLRCVTGVSNLMMKNGEDEDDSVAGTSYVFNNTFVAEEYDKAFGFGDSTRVRTYGLHSTGWYNMVSRNNIIITGPGRLAIRNVDKNSNGTNSLSSDYDYDVIWNYSVQTPTLESLVNTNGDVVTDRDPETHGVVGNPLFTNKANGVFTLASNDTVAKGNGIAIPGFNDSTNIGALKGTDSLIPVRPLDVSADKYIVTLKSGSATETVKLTSDYTTSKKFTVVTNDDTITVTPSATSIGAKGTVTFTVGLKDKKLPAKNTHYAASTNNKYKYRDKAYHAAFMIRFEDGLSVPVLVKIARQS